MFERIARYWLLFMLIFLPFQGILMGLFQPVGYLDEITVTAFIPFAIWRFYKKKESSHKLFVIVLFPVFIFIAVGLVSGIKNENPLFVTILGLFDYLKNFLPLFIYAAFIKDFKEIKRLFNIILIVAVGLSVVAIFQELWALSNRYIFQPDKDYTNLLWRLGIFRTPSLMVDPSVFGLYCVMVLTVYLNIYNKPYHLYTIPLITGVLMSVSRIAYTGFVLLGLSQIIRGQKWFIALLIPMFILMIVIFSIEDINVLKYLDIDRQFLLYGDEALIDFRDTAKEGAIQIWREHLLIGAGPGSYGGIVSVKYNPSIYERYKLPSDFVFHLKMQGSIDQFWLQLLAECGITGIVSFTMFLVSIIIVLLILKIWASSEEVSALFSGLIVITLIIFIYSLYSGLNLTPILFTYSAFTGMAIGNESRHYFV
ncbi:MAG: hypothetical protein Fur0020_00360 [Thermodesulfovibrionia bacterium]